MPTFFSLENEVVLCLQNSEISQFCKGHAFRAKFFNLWVWAPKVVAKPRRGGCSKLPNPLQEKAYCLILFGCLILFACLFVYWGHSMKIFEDLCFRVSG